MDKIKDRQVKIQSTLLEYGQQNVLLTSVINNQQQAQQQQKTSKVGIPLKEQQEQQQKQQQAAAAEEANLKKLINEMSEADQKQVTRTLVFFNYN